MTEPALDAEDVSEISRPSALLRRLALNAALYSSCWRIVIRHEAHKLETFPLTYPLLLVQINDGSFVNGRILVTQFVAEACLLKSVVASFCVVRP
jgi:hypothetical protein